MTLLNMFTFFFDKFFALNALYFGVKVLFSGMKSILYWLLLIVFIFKSFSVLIALVLFFNRFFLLYLLEFVLIL